MTKSKLHIAHQVPGRIRLKVAGAKHNPELLEEVKAAFSAIPGIAAVKVNPATGSIVVNYDTDRHDEFHGHLNTHYSDNLAGEQRLPNNEIDELAHKIEQEAEFLAEHSHAARVVVDFCKKLDKEIKLATGNNLDLTMLLAVGVAGFTIFEVGATAATPVWVTLSVFAINHYINSHAAQIQAVKVRGPVGATA
jgi:hypothetical protein